MCGRYTVPYTGSDIEAKFELSNHVDKFEPTWNASPGSTLPVVTKNSPKKGIMMKWGFVAPWEKDFTKAKFKPINARNDKLTGGFYRQAFKVNRCLIPASGYYEWKKFTLEGKEQKQPYYFTAKSHEPMSLGGIYSVFEDAEKMKHYFFAIITVEPNSVQKPIHDRMPLIIDLKDRDKCFDTEKPLDLVKSYPSKLMETWRVPHLKGDGPRLIEKLPD